MLAFAFVALLSAMRDDTHRQNFGLVETPVEQEAAPSPQPQAYAVVGHDSQEAGGLSAPMAEPEGANSAASGASVTRVKARPHSPSHGKAAAIENARKAGILGVFDSSDLPPATVDNFTSGLDDRDLYGIHQEMESDALAGGWGYGVSGTGPGGGGGGWGTIGIGDYGTIGHGRGRALRSGQQSDYGTGGHPPGWDFRCGCIPSIPVCAGSTVTQMEVTVSEPGNKRIVRRYLRRQRARLRHCYEKALLVEPKLLANPTFEFQISPLGQVQGVSGSDSDNTELGMCLAKTIYETVFPKHETGTYLRVRLDLKLRPGRNRACWGTVRKTGDP
jgi:hypothetical protein